MSWHVENEIQRPIANVPFVALGFYMWRDKLLKKDLHAKHRIPNVYIDDSTKEAFKYYSAVFFR